MRRSAVQNALGGLSVVGRDSLELGDVDDADHAITGLVRNSGNDRGT
jgi:hypothetical protein